MFGSTLTLNCSVTSDIIINQLLLMWRAPSGATINNSTDFTSLSGGGVSSSLVLQLDLMVTSDAGQYTCEVMGQSGGQQITTSEHYSVKLQG